MFSPGVPKSHLGQMKILTFLATYWNKTWYWGGGGGIGPYNKKKWYIIVLYAEQIFIGLLFKFSLLKNKTDAYSISVNTLAIT